MPALPKPTFDCNYSVDTEIGALRDWRNNEPTRQIPARAGNRLLVATWNIANLGVHDRRTKDHRVIAEMISWFDIMAVQEVNQDLSGLRAVMQHLPATFSAMFTDKAGNNERMTYLYRSNKVTPLEEVGEVAVPPKDHRYIKLPGITQTYSGFDRNPYVAAFSAGNFEFALVNVHLYFGRDTTAHRGRRALEAYATSRWGDLRRNSPDAYTQNVIVLGDFNLPKYVPGDLIYEALRRRGMRRPEHSTRIYSNLVNDKDYDQIMFFPGPVRQAFTGNIGVFDYDTVIFRGLWNTRTALQFRAYTKYYISDHRLLWAEFRV